MRKGVLRDAFFYQLRCDLRRFQTCCFNQKTVSCYFLFDNQKKIAKVKLDTCSKAQNLLLNVWNNRDADFS